MNSTHIEVISYSGYRGEESPKAFILHGESIEVIEILKMWIEESSETRESKRFFKVRGSDGYEVGKSCSNRC
ncbi:MAG: hypothetical protein AB1488_05570 [Nitrospirota bacterium]